MTSRFVLRTPEDILALVPVALGFHPAQSLVMVAFTADGPSFHARVDLPRAPDHVEEVVARLVGAARQHHVATAIVLAYTEEAQVPACWDVVRHLRLAGVSVIDVIRVGADHYWTGRDVDGLGVEEFVDGPGSAYDVSTHPFVVERIVSGSVIRSGRDELHDTLITDPAQVERIEAAIARQLQSRPDPPDELELGWLHARSRRFIRDRGALTDEEAARVLCAVSWPLGRDAAWESVGRGEAAGLVDMWADLVRRAPAPWSAHAAAVLALLSWISGDGALAWCAVDRSLETDPDNSLARLVAQILEAAISPTTWRPVHSTG